MSVAVTTRLLGWAAVFVLRAAANPIGRRVKLADLEDNCDLSRLADPTARDHVRVAKYRRAIETLRRLPPS
jgi:hypothetical protein